MTTKLTGCCGVRIDRRTLYQMTSELSRRTFLTAVAVGALCERPGRSQTAPTVAEQRGAQAQQRAASNVRLGVCTSDVAGAIKYGFDYIEPAAADVAAMNDDKFRQYADEVLSSPIR